MLSVRERIAQFEGNQAQRLQLLPPKKSMQRLAGASLMTVSTATGGLSTAGPAMSTGGYSSVPPMVAIGQSTYGSPSPARATPVYQAALRSFPTHSPGTGIPAIAGSVQTYSPSPLRLSPLASLPRSILVQDVGRPMTAVPTRPVAELVNASSWTRPQSPVVPAVRVTTPNGVQNLDMTPHTVHTGLSGPTVVPNQQALERIEVMAAAATAPRSGQPVMSGESLQMDLPAELATLPNFAEDQLRLTPNLVSYNAGTFPQVYSPAQLQPMVYPVGGPAQIIYDVYDIDDVVPQHYEQWQPIAFFYRSCE